MTEITKYAVRQKSTGWYIPKPYGRQGRGGSHTEPLPVGSTDTANRWPAEPRLFDTERAARCFISAWMQGKFVVYRTPYDFYDGSGGDEDISVVHQPHRNREDMEIIPIKIGFP